MIREVRSQRDKEIFAKAGVDFSRRYPNGIIRLYASELNATDQTKNFFFRNGGQYQAFLYGEKDQVSGRVAAFINRLMVEEEKQIGLVGSFDCIPDYKVAKVLLDSAISWLYKQGCTEIWGPVDFSIWHNYRFMTRGFESYAFVGEPRNPEYYPEYFETYGFTTKFTWESQLLNKEDMLQYISEYKEQTDIMDKLGYTFIKLNKKNRHELMLNTWKVIMQTYKVFPGFTPITENEFMEHYNHMPDLLDKESSLFIIAPDGKFAGFILVLKDYNQSLNAMDGKTNLPAKLRFLLNSNKSCMANLAQGAALPVYLKELAVQGRAKYGIPVSIGGTMVCKSMQSIIASGKYEKSILSLMREGAHIRNHAGNLASEKREYAVYELKKPNR